jgi:hypothetical protein
MVLAGAAYLNCKSLREFCECRSVPALVESAKIRARLTDCRILTKVKRLGLAATKISWPARPICFATLGWEVVQSVVHQPLEVLSALHFTDSKDTYLRFRTVI